MQPKITMRAQNWLDTNLEELYQKSLKNGELWIRAGDILLEGKLALGSDFANITLLRINQSNITSLNLKFCAQLTNIDCESNLLTNIDFLANLPCPEKLEYLNLDDNNIRPTTLNFLSRFINLKKIWLGSGDYWIRKGQPNIFNRFYGSLEPLKHLEKLNFVSISNTDVDSGLEHWEGKSLKSEIFASCKERPNARASKLWKELNPDEYWRFKNHEAQKEKEEKELAKAKLKKKIAITVIILVVLVSFLTFLYFFSRRKQPPKNKK